MNKIKYTHKHIRKAISTIPSLTWEHFYVLSILDIVLFLFLK